MRTRIAGSPSRALGDTRRAEVAVFVEFMTASRTDPALRGLAREAAEGSRGLIARILHRLAALGDLRPALDPGAEAVHLWALIDGLSSTPCSTPTCWPPRTAWRPYGATSTGSPRTLTGRRAPQAAWPPSTENSAPVT